MDRRQLEASNGRGYIRTPSRCELTVHQQRSRLGRRPLSAEQIKWNFQREFNKITLITNKFEGVRTEYAGNPHGPRLVRIMLVRFLEWFDQHDIDESFLIESAWDAMNELLLEREDMLALFNLILDLPSRKTVSSLEFERPLMVEAVELAAGLTLVVGNGIVLYEAYLGRDRFCYRLTNLERGILTASCLLAGCGGDS
ncbi:uncharacterized protein Z519_07215 [Cladophialophora bantiana CBS 173.52]|uniref:Uncharacterized protein n=1 Tax=Cladophialophora bantiana (strain ATCC 10958 / CBS 173.52 / CDC B-1940 / NIH 8579) TaxID=1442370 RepID=A0A0D2EQJ6_CLAB1|nr:uncharacterized protein Z519_07215 [Cladophialophora bantiana CBS 173.52]KIW92231.1 hypothetical protein Z519_07215 [Cladophialophora bantiana CBS 173.52]